MNTLLYCTSRALIVQYLEDDSHPHLVQWIDKDKNTCRIHYDMIYEWLKITRPDRKERSQLSQSRDIDDYTNSLFSSACPIKENFGDDLHVFTDYQLATKSTDQRAIVDYFVGNKLIEWIIQLLLEKTHVDMIMWTDKAHYQFQFLDLEALSRMYAKVQNRMTSAPLYQVKLLLSSYCSTGILTKIDKGNHHYQFNNEWYKKEKFRMVELDESTDNIQVLAMKSLMKFPELTQVRDLFD